MELTLTGASLSSDSASAAGKNKNKNNRDAASAGTVELPNVNSGSSTNYTNKADTLPSRAAHSQCQHSQHGSSTGGAANNNTKSCCHSQTTPIPANFQSVESIPVDKLLAHPNMLYSAIIACIKGGPYETFTYLADIVLTHEKKTGKPLEWGTPLENTKRSGTAGGKGGNGHLLDGKGEIISGGSSLGRRTDDGHTLSHWAAKRVNDTRFIEYLANVPSLNIHAASSDKVGMLPIHWAATEGSIPIIALILKHLNSNSGYATNSSLSTNATNNQRCANPNGSPLIDLNDPINDRDASGCTPLLIAAQYGHADLAAFLIKRGADPNAVDLSEDTALHWAAYKGSVPVCGLLLHLNGIEGHLDVRDKYGQAPLHLASLRGNVDVLQYLMDQTEGYVERMVEDMVASGGGTVGGGLSVGLLGNSDRSLRNTASNENNDDEDPEMNSMRVENAIERMQQFPAKLLNLPDKDGKSPLDLALKKKKTACEIVLKDYMDKHCNTNRSLFGRMKQNIGPFFSCKNWKTWMGLTPDIGSVNGSPRLIFWFVVTQLFFAIMLELIVYAPILDWAPIEIPGLEGYEFVLEEYVILHFLTISFLMITVYSLYMVNQTDPGILSVTGFTAASSDTRTFCGHTALAHQSKRFFSINSRIKRDMEQLTRELRNQYEETLESFASETNPNSPQQGMNHKLALCHSCHIAKPLRSKHCRVLNQCVLNFDHHCPFVGATIGLYNYKYFYMFILFMTLAEVLFGVTGILFIRHSDKVNHKILVLHLWLSVFGLMSAALLFYHTQLVNRNLTTNEDQNRFRLKYLMTDDGTFFNPFDKNFVWNWKNRFFPSKASYMIAYEEDNHQDRKCCNDEDCGNGGIGGLNVSMSGSKKEKDEDENNPLMMV